MVEWATRAVSGAMVGEDMARGGQGEEEEDRVISALRWHLATESSSSSEYNPARKMRWYEASNAS